MNGQGALQQIQEALEAKEATKKVSVTREAKHIDPADQSWRLIARQNGDPRQGWISNTCDEPSRSADASTTDRSQERSADSDSKCYGGDETIKDYGWIDGVVQLAISFNVFERSTFAIACSDLRIAAARCRHRFSCRTQRLTSGRTWRLDGSEQNCSSQEC